MSVRKTEVRNQKSERRRRDDEVSCVRSRIWTFIGAPIGCRWSFTRRRSAFPKIEQFALGGSDPAGEQIHLRRISRKDLRDSAVHRADFNRFLVMAYGIVRRDESLARITAAILAISTRDGEALASSEYVELARMLHGLMNQVRNGRFF